MIVGAILGKTRTVSKRKKPCAPVFRNTRSFLICRVGSKDGYSVFFGFTRKQARAGKSSRAPSMFTKNMKVSRIPMSA